MSRVLKELREATIESPGGGAVQTEGTMWSFLIAIEKKKIVA